jgi:hypothetical protein
VEVLQTHIDISSTSNLSTQRQADLSGDGYIDLVIHANREGSGEIFIFPSPAVIRARISVSDASPPPRRITHPGFDLGEDCTYSPLKPDLCRPLVGLVVCDVDNSGDREYLFGLPPIGGTGEIWVYDELTFEPY